ncbi:MAG: hypothetical protein ACLQBY_02595 [Solirubrobacteraceae bacterium]
MPRTLFAERFLVTPVGPEPPEPAGYDEAQGISVTADGRPFIEAGAVLATRTLTEAEGEGDDDDEDRHPGVRGAASVDAQLLATRTATFVDAEGADTDEDSPAPMALHTDTRAAGEKPDAAPWAHTETAAPGEPADYDRVAFFVTVTKAAGESSD